MKVDIKTDNGHMVVDLVKFFPAGPSRVRKLFGLMRCGLAPERQEEVRAFLEDWGREAVWACERAEAEQERLLAYQAELEGQIEALKERKAATARILQEQRRKHRTAALIGAKAPGWLQEFDATVWGVKDTQKRVGQEGGQGDAASGNT